jgi:hypothetical protein
VATYKLIQDVEAEDHILGPLSFRQFVFALIAAFLGYLCFLSVVKHVPFMLVILAPPTLFCAFFAFPWGRDQPTETWALAKLRFFFLPRKRIWNQSGLKELVTINVPKKVERVYTNGLSQSEVQSRLQALANTIDSRGWAIKHLDAVGYAPQQTDSDRLIGIPDVPPAEPDVTAPSDDIMDAEHNPIAQQFDDMITRSSQERRERLIEELRAPLPETPQQTQAEPQWFMNHNPAAGVSPIPTTPVITPTPAASTPVPSVQVPTAQPAAPEPTLTADDDAPYKLMARQFGFQEDEALSNLRTLRAAPSQPAPAGAAAAQPAQDVPANNAAGPMTAGGDPAILSLSKNNDLNVATIAREAQKVRGDQAQDEVVISLH